MTARQVELVIRRDGHPERRMVLAVGPVVVGRAEDNDIVLSEIGVSRRHARIVVEEDGVFVEDMGSGNGTWFRGNRVTRQAVADGDEVVIDPFTLGFTVSGGDNTAEVTNGGGDATVLLGGALVAHARLDVVSAHTMARRSFELLPGGSLSLGRSERADIVLPEPAASRLHADVGETAGSYWVRDRGSSNGTWVNGQRVREKVLVDGDRVRIGTVEFTFVAPPVVHAEEPSDHTEAFDAVMFTAAIAAPSAPPANLAPPPPPRAA
ncbi:MAG: FHA domain-containing protein, partial [Myxococcota bacterium]